MLVRRLAVSALMLCWLGGRKGIWPVKKLSFGVLAWFSALEVFLNDMRYINPRFTYFTYLSVWSEVQTCIWPS